ncbi:SDR family oxidoreductase [Actinomadura flavalba]|uniref:SDR family oxidoreductase n=1 Tax=Actinomadura flavalba TaxID=1120938 RepID=UPI00035EFA9E|nr:SDR family oxidoreductase [Actinomadura flavalba]
MDLGLNGKVALVAAASSGLGLGAARALAAEGASVSICARDGDRLAEAHKDVAAAGSGDVRSAVVDLSNPAAVERWVEHSASDLGGIDVLVSHTGGVTFGTTDDFGVQDYRGAVETTMLPHIAMTKAALPYLKENGWGRVVLVTSESVKQPMAHNVLSGTARLGVLGYARSLVQTLGPAGVTVNVLAPGYHATKALKGPNGSDPETCGSEVPLGRVGDPDDFGALAAFLASEQASFVTGALLLVDGGNTRAVL